MDACRHLRHKNVTAAFGLLLVSPSSDQPATPPTATLVASVHELLAEGDLFSAIKKHSGFGMPLPESRAVLTGVCAGLSYVASFPILRRAPYVHLHHVPGCVLSLKRAA